MELIIGKTAGFCFGVRNAVDKTYEEINKNTKDLYCLGELVHNEKIVEDITKKGVITVEDISDIPNNSNVIIRAHGVEPNIYDIAKEKNLKLIDLTCPKVAKVHEFAKAFSNDGYYIMLIAERKHPETIGTKGFCGKNSTIIESIENVESAIKNFKESNLTKIGIIAQTTFSVEKFNTIVENIKSRLDCQIEVKNTICNATEMRQAETEELSKKVDLMIAIGGKNSANTKRLYNISAKNCENAILIQSNADLALKEVLENNFEKIGIMAGASTPKYCIDEVVGYINNFKN